MERIVKIMFAVFVLSFTVMAMPIVCKAYTAPDNNEYEYKYKVMNGPILMDMYSNKECCLCTQSGYEQDGNYRLYTVSDDKTRLYSIEFSPNNHYFHCATSYYGSGTEVPFNFGYTSTTTTYDSAVLSKNYTGYSELQTFSTYQSAYEYLITPRVDFDNIIYDPFIPTPSFTVTYTEDASTLPRFPLEVSLVNSSSDYYVEVVMENMTPSFVGVRPDGTFEALRYYQFQSDFVYPMDGFTPSNELTTQLLSASLSSAWRNDILSYDPTNSSSFYVPISDSAEFGNSLIYTGQCLKYNQFRQIACFYGNNTGISIRYFRIDDGQIYAGKVRSWTNLYGGKFSESLPDYYKPYEVAQGYEKENTEIVPIETSSPNVDAPNNQYGTKTGLTINVNVGSSVPNYPNYPTIASYNLDNLLVQTMDRSDDIGGFLHGISGFAGAALSFIPDYVWQLVAFGLGLSILVMFLKIL